MKKLVRESLSYDSNLYRISVEDFVEWFNNMMTSNSDAVDWESIKSTLMNDEYSSDDELIENLEENEENLSTEAILELVSKRDYFLDFRYAQEI